MPKRTLYETEQQMREVALLIVGQSMRPAKAYGVVARALREGPARALTTVERLKSAYPKHAKALEDEARRTLDRHDARRRALLGDRPAGVRTPVSLALSSKGRLVLDIRILATAVQTAELTHAQIDALNKLIARAKGIMG